MKRYIQGCVQIVLILVVISCSWNLVFADGEGEVGGGATEISVCKSCVVDGMEPSQLILTDNEVDRLNSCVADTRQFLDREQREVGVSEQDRIITCAIEVRANNKDIAYKRYLHVKTWLQSKQAVYARSIYHAPDHITYCDDVAECNGVLVHICRADGEWTQTLIANYNWVQDDEEKVKQGRDSNEPDNDTGGQELTAQQKDYLASTQKKIEEEYLPKKPVGEKKEEDKDKKKGERVEGKPVSSQAKTAPEPVSGTSVPENEKSQEAKPKAVEPPEDTSPGSSGLGGAQESRDWSSGIAEFSISGGYTVHMPFKSDLLLEDRRTDFKPQHAGNFLFHMGIPLAEDWLLLTSIGGGYGNRNLDGFFSMGIQPVLLWRDYVFFLPGVNVRAFHPDREEVFLQGRQITTGAGLGACFFLSGKLCVEFLYEVGDIVEAFPLQQGGKEAVASFGLGFYPRVRYMFYIK